MTPSKGSIVCTHERGHGTTVCVHCRHAARATARERRHRLALRAGALAIVVTTLGAVGVVSATAIRARASTRKTDRSVAATADRPPEVVVAGEPRSQTPVLTQPAATPRADTIARGKAPFTPVLPQGQSSLPQGPTALRTDSLVTVSFDTPMIRTRIPAKFERLVRSTLPAVYGRSIDSVLSKIPEGGIARQGDLVSELPTRGVRIPVNSDWAITLYPETRPGQDGPLVVRYRVSVVGKTE
jgi:hypothetical protein